MTYLISHETKIVGTWTHRHHLRLVRDRDVFEDVGFNLLLLLGQAAQVIGES